MQVDSLMKGRDQAVFYSPGFRRVLEDHLSWLIQDPNTRILPLEAHNAVRFSGDFYGLLAIVYGIPYEHHYIVMRMSGLYGSHELNENMRAIRVPSPTVIQQLLSVYKSSN